MIGADMPVAHRFTVQLRYDADSQNMHDLFLVPFLSSNIMPYPDDPGSMILNGRGLRTLNLATTNPLDVHYTKVCAQNHSVEAGPMSSLVSFSCIGGGGGPLATCDVLTGGQEPLSAKNRNLAWNQRPRHKNAPLFRLVLLERPHLWTGLYPCDMAGLDLKGPLRAVLGREVEAFISCSSCPSLSSSLTCLKQAFQHFTLFV